MIAKPNRYALITAARNEHTHIAATIESVLSQTLLPEKWVLVSDESTDGTDEIIRKYQRYSPFMEYRRLTHRDQWNFGSKARAVNSAYKQIQDISFEFVAILDADITFEPDYYATVVERMLMYPKLGIAGGVIAELENGKFHKLKYNFKSVAGAIQLFRRKCFDEIGGYAAAKHGGIDAIAEIISRMRGWEVCTFPDIVVYHHRRIGLTKHNLIKSRFRYGQRDYCMGTHPVFMLLKCLDRLRERPYVAGSMAMLTGYLWSSATREELAVSGEVRRYLRREQWERLVSKLRRNEA